MADTALIGEPFTFQAFFVDANNQPVVVTSPVIEVFRFDDTGARVQLVIAGTAMTVIPADPGRYTFTTTLPTTIAAGQMVYSRMEGTDPGTGGTLLVEQPVTMVGEVGYPVVAQTGLRASFVPP